jgi:hypothetical protein
MSVSKGEKRENEERCICFLTNSFITLYPRFFHVKLELWLDTSGAMVGSCRSLFTLNLNL